MHRSSISLAVFGISLALPVRFLDAQEDEATPHQAEVTVQAEELVQAALQAELVGNNLLRGAKLKQARELAPVFGPAHWHSAHVRVGGAWLPIEQAEKEARADKNLARYRVLRQQHAGHLQGETRLAGWCERVGLIEQSRAHWYQVLRLDRDNKRALKALDARWNGRTLETNEQLQHWKLLRERIEREVQERGRSVAKWRRLILEGSPNERKAALEELAAMSDELAARIIVEVLLKPTDDETQMAQLQLEAVRMLGKFDDPGIGRFLAWYALISPSEEAREAARDGLKHKPLQSYVPFLLTQLTMPLEVGISTRVQGNQVASDYTFYREGGPAGRDYERRQSSFQRVPGPRNLSALTATATRRLVPEQVYRTACNALRRVPAHYETSITGVSRHYAANPQFTARQQAALRREAQKGDAVAAEVERRNQATQQQNERVAEVLRHATNVQLESHPRAWWDWWQQYVDEHPELRQVGQRGRMTQVLSDRPTGSLATGTVVWTSTGRQSIEHVKIGDLVLAQDPITGELAYKPVLKVLHSVQPVRRLDLSEDAFQCAPGQLFWRTGEGWWFAQDLNTQFLVHGLFGSMSVTGNSEQIPGETRHLIVADLSNFFVGNHGLLVHDATQPPPLGVGLPGLVREAH